MIHKRLLDWYDVNKRELPWRKSCDAYRIWISEIMLQQTRVEAVIPYYERFLSHFPTVADLAASEVDKLTNLWAGLGYYSRARNLRLAAMDVMARFGGVIPHGFSDLRSLKGIGDYTAAAIASIAYGHKHVALDGNLERVLSRLLGMREDPKSKIGRETLLKFGQAIVDQGRAGEVNQALMDLSSAVCATKNPRCLACPLSADCKARKLGLTSEIPLKKKKMEKIELQSHGLLLVQESESAEPRILLARRKKDQWLAGMWDLPWWIEEKNQGAPNLRAAVKFGEHEAVRTITKHKIRYKVHFTRTSRSWSTKELQENLPDCAEEFRWEKLSALEELNLPKPSEKALSIYLRQALNRARDEYPY